MRHWSILGILLLATTSTANAMDTKLLEAYALAENRAAVLDTLIPGTEDYYYLHGLDAQHRGALDEAQTLLDAWEAAAPNQEIALRTELRNRQALLRYADNPEDTLAYLTRHLGLSFGHQRDLPGQTSSAPVRLDPDLLDWDRLATAALENAGDNDSLRRFNDSALFRLMDRPLNDARRRELLGRLRLPDHPRTVELIAADLETRGSGGFGSHAIHDLLDRPQLEALAGRRPALLGDARFVSAYLARLQPNPDIDWVREPEAKAAYLDEIIAFSERLPAYFSQLKAHALYHRLDFDRQQGTYDRARFLSYLELPREAPHLARNFVNRIQGDLNVRRSQWQQIQAPLILPRQPQEESLVEDYLARFFIDARNYDDFAPYLEEGYLRRIFAETKILAGAPGAEQWQAWLTPAQIEALRERVEVAFDLANPRSYAVEAPVALDVWVKNVDTLIVKVFEINTYNYYRQNGRHVNTDIDLDGLVARDETVYNYEAPPQQRVMRRFDFPELQGPGVWVVECIGNGMSSRAVIRKGMLSYLVRDSAAGQVFSVLDANNEAVEDATLFVDGREYSADEEGGISVPFSANPGRRAVVLRDGDFAHLDFADRSAEQYRFSAGLFVDPEALRAGREAELAIRPALYVNGTRIPVGLLEEPVLTLHTTDVEGTESTSEIRDLVLHDDVLTIHAFRVPEQLRFLECTLSGKVRKLSDNQFDTQSVSTKIAVNGIDAEAQTDYIYLRKLPEGYAAEFLGKNGEPRGGRSIRAMFTLRDFQQGVTQYLQTDAQGRCYLGALPGVTDLHLHSSGTNAIFQLAADATAQSSSVWHAAAGETISIPYTGAATRPAREHFAFFETRNGVNVRDSFDALALAEGYLRLEDLPRGDYTLTLKETNEALTLRVSEGSADGMHVFSGYRQLEHRAAPPVQIASVETGVDALRVRVLNATHDTRVHVLADRFTQTQAIRKPFLGLPEWNPGLRVLPAAESMFISGRNIGEEYQYIIDRKYATKYPGNMLERPGLLLNPWAVQDTETDTQEAKAGQAPAASPPPASPVGEPASASSRAEEADLTIYGTHDFLGGDTVAQFNLALTDSGEIRINRDALAGRGEVTIVVTDPGGTALRRVVVEPGEVARTERRLDAAIPPDANVAEQKQAVVLPAGETLAFADPGSADFEAYTTLAEAWQLLRTVSGNTEIAQFEFAVRWPVLTQEEKRARYEDFASHELNFFLYRHDPEFFQSVVAPHLANKFEKTFMDHWLLGADCTQYLDTWAYQQLNLIERILLAQRIDAQKEAVRRYIADWLQLQPPAVSHTQFNWYFDTALAGKKLDANNNFFATYDADFGAVRLSNQVGFVANGVSDLGYGGGFGGRAAGADAYGANTRFLGRQAELRQMRENIPALQESLAYSFESGLAESTNDFVDAPALEEKENLDMLALGVHFDGRVEELGDVLRRRSEVQRMYQRLEATQELAENQYYHLPMAQDTAARIAANSFWRDYVDHDSATPFLSARFPEASGSLTEAMMALAVLDLPFESADHESVLDEDGFRFTPATPVIAFYKELRETPVAEEALPLLVNEHFVPVQERFRLQDGETVDNLVTGEFLTQRIYTGIISVTNPSARARNIEVLYQIPRGALPVAGARYTKSAPVRIEGYQTHRAEYSFYFPEVGNFTHYPAHVTEREEIVGAAEGQEITVVDTPSTVDTESWEYVSQQADEAAVLHYLREYNLMRTDLSRILWRMRDESFFNECIALLNARRHFDQNIWSYAIEHDNAAAVSAFLASRDDFVDQCGPYLDSPLLEIVPRERRAYEHLEYAPLVNARAHPLGGEHKILNDRFAMQYANFVNILAHREALNAEDELALTYYLLLQERIEEALETFVGVPREGIETKIQYDYLAAYLALYEARIDDAARIAANYEAYPEARWANRFAALRGQLEEIGGGAAAIADAQNREQVQDAATTTEPVLDFEFADGQLRITHRNVDSLRLNFYLMDLELLFSKNPFEREDTARFASVLPNGGMDIEVQGDGTFDVPIPPDYARANVLVELRGAGIVRSRAHYANALDVQTIEQFGQVRVRHAESGAALGKVYVKVFARTGDGGVRFFKDGYTDLRGRFDYATLSTGDLDNVQRFALLVMSEDNGATVREAAPPRW